MNKLWTVVSYILVAALASVMTLNMTLGSFKTQPVQQAEDEYCKLEQLGDLIEDRFIGEADRVEMEDAAAHAMIASLDDRWSYYIPADEYADYLEQMANAYVGIGVTIQVTEETAGFLIVKVNEGGPADEAGILPGDMLVGVDGVDVRGMTTTETSVLVKGEEGTFVDITVLRDGQELTQTVERRAVEVQVVTSRMLDENVGYIAIANFHTNCARETIAAIKTLLENGAQSLVFDVRNNGGGYANEMNQILDYLLPAGDLFRTVDYTGKEEVTRSDAGCLEIPMVVLVNASSYSAAEFFAAALREYDAAVIVGQQTSGKGYFQVTYQLSDGSAVGLSIGKYFTPKGVSLDGVGVTPDVTVEVDAQTDLAIYYGTLDAMEDPQILAALEALK